MTNSRVGRRVGGAVILAAGLIAPQPVIAIERLHRVFDHRDGLPVDTVADVAQDAAGFIWIATPGGLVRFDGDEMRRWDDRARGISRIVAGPSGQLVAIDKAGHLLRIDPAGGFKPFIGSERREVQDARDAVFDASGALWIVRAGGVSHLAPDGSWRSYFRDAFEHEAPRAIRADGVAGVLVITDGGIWSPGLDGRARRVARVSQAVDALRQSDGSLLVLAGDSVLEEEAGTLNPVFTLAARPIALTRRHESVWVAFDRYVVRLAPGEPPAIIGPESGLPAGGRMLIDREGSLWICSFRGLMHFPEPDTVMWSQPDGLPSSHARFLGRQGDHLWISTWGGLARLRSTASGPAALGNTVSHTGDVCIDASGGLWYMTDRLIEFRAGATTPHDGFDWPLRFCAPSRDGSIWLGLGRTLARAGPAGVEPVAGPPISGNGRVIAPLLEGQDGTLWVEMDGQLCRTRATRPKADDWTCEAVPWTAEPASMMEVDGTFWFATTGQGIFRRDGRMWRQIPASATHGGGQIFKLRPGADGSIWVLSLAMPSRVVDRPGSDDGWEVVEVISSWHGQPSGGASDLLEDPDGTIWTATAAGLVRVPGHARRLLFDAPAVHVADLFVDGRRVAADALLELAHRRNLVEMRFAALTYRDRSRLRYQGRLASGAGWRDLSAGGPVFRFPNLPAGDYLADVRATIDGRTWSADGQRLALRIAGPWYSRPPFLALSGAALALMLVAFHRARVHVALRLERQRTSIAMDLHDEIGSGLGSIGILAGVADARLVTDKDHSLLREIAETAGELSTSLGDIVWSLRSGGHTLQDLLDRIADRGQRLFPDGGTLFVMRPPDRAASIRLSLAAQRNVLLIVVEALHNAARHARARQVEVGLTANGRRWRVWVADDGAGLGEVAPGRPSSGLGLSSMRRRAEQIGADLSVHSRATGGTTVSLVFDPDAGERGRRVRMTMRGTDGPRRG